MTMTITLPIIATVIVTIVTTIVVAAAALLLLLLFPRVSILNGHTAIILLTHMIIVPSLIAHDPLLTFHRSTLVTHVHLDAPITGTSTGAGLVRTTTLGTGLIVLSLGFCHPLFVLFVCLGEKMKDSREIRCSLIACGLFFVCFCRSEGFCCCCCRRSLFHEGVLQVGLRVFSGRKITNRTSNLPFWEYADF